MKKILMSLLTIAIVGALMTGGAIAMFSDVEQGTGTFSAGTIDIAIDGDNPWEGTFTIENAKPCQKWFVTYVITNEGNNPCVVWKHLKDVVYGPGTPMYPPDGGSPTCSSEPEFLVDPDDTKNKIGKWIWYDLYSEITDPVPPVTVPSTDPWHQTLYDQDELVHNLKCVPIILGSIPPGGTMIVIQSYHLDIDTPNKHQGDTMDFTVEFYAQQLEGTTLLMENKVKPAQGEPSIVQFGDGTKGLLDYDTVGSTFDYTFEAQGLKKDGTYYLIYYADPWKGDNPGAVIATLTASGGNIPSTSGSTELNMDLPDPADANFGIGAKIWLVPDSDYNPATKQMTAWNEEDYLFETWLIHYNDTDVP